MKPLLILVLLLVVSGCSTNFSNSSLLSDKSTAVLKKKGVVDLSYSYGIFDGPVVNRNKLKVSALEKCMLSGYQSAQEAETKTTCDISFENNICKTWSVSVSFQCIS